MLFPAAVTGTFLRDVEQFELGLLPFEATSAVTATIAVDITNDFVVAATLAEGIGSTIAVDITNDFTVAAAFNVAAGVVGTIAVDITADFVVAAALQETIGSAIAVDITNDFVVAATLLSTTSVVGSIAVDITNDFVVAAALSSAAPVAFSCAVDITNDFAVAAVIQNGAVFAIPNIGNPRIGAHASTIRPWPTKDPDAFLPHYFNWSNWAAIEQGGNIASYELAVDDGDGALVITDPAQGSGQYINWIQVWVKSGSEGETYVVRCSVTLEDGRQEDASRSLTIASH